MVEPLIDSHSRSRISSEIDSTLFVRAGAGTGKTTSMVSRIISIVESGVDITKIAAITFTDAAATELAHRIRMRLLDKVAQEGESFGLAKRALDLLGSAPIGTIHSLANSILSSNPLEVGLPLVFSTMDEVEEALFFQREWDSFFVDVFGDPVAATSISLLVELGIKPSDLFEMARSIDNKVLDPGDYRHKKETLSAPDTNYQEEVVDVFDEIHGIIEEIDALGANPQYQYALADQDALAQLVSSLVDAGARLREALSSSEPSLAFLYLSSRVAPYFPTAKPGNKGKAANWGGAPQKNAVVEMIREIQDRRQGVVEKITEALCENVFSVLCGFVIELRLARRRGGKITFGDQLNLCLELLRDAPPQLVCEIRNSYSVIMVDEFQDTDPVQLEIVKRLSGTFERSIDAQEKTPLAPLFFVGDPRQSIYRFRGADLDGYLLVARSTSAESRVDLNVNFRSNEEIVNWVNDSFEDYFAITSGLPASPLASVRQRSDRYEPVSLLASSKYQVVDEGFRISADQRRQVEVELVIATINKLIDEGHLIQGEDGLRPVEYGDIAILVPDRAILDELFWALRGQGIDFLSSKSTSIYSDPLISELFMLLRAGVRPYDGLCLFHALRSSLMGFSDQDLVDLSLPHGSLGRAVEAIRRGFYAAHTPELDQKVERLKGAISFLDDLNDRARTRSAYECLLHVIDSFSLVVRGSATSNPPELWRRLDYVKEEAFSWSSTGAGELGSYVSFVTKKMADNLKTNESEGGDLGTSNVRIMTIHASKGLEFPVVILTSTASSLTRSHRSTHLVYGGGAKVISDRFGQGVVPLAYRFHKEAYSDGYEQAANAEKELDLAESVRLCYVATTRAKDRLFVTIPATGDEIAAAKTLWGSSDISNIRFTWELLVALSKEAVNFVETDLARPVVSTTMTRSHSMASTKEMVQARLEIERSIRRGTWINASQLEVDKPYRHSRSKGSTPTSALPSSRSEVGSYVHLCLAEAIFDDPAQTMDRSKLLLSNLGVDPLTIGLVCSILEVALEVPSIRNAKDSMREFPIVATLEGIGQVHGVIDLGYVIDGHLRLFDYKVVSTLEDDFVNEALDRYKGQGFLYKALAQSCNLGVVVDDVRFIFLTKDGYREVEAPQIGEDELLDMAISLDPTNLDLD